MDTHTGTPPARFPGQRERERGSGGKAWCARAPCAQQTWRLAKKSRGPSQPYADACVDVCGRLQHLLLAARCALLACELAS